MQVRNPRYGSCTVVEAINQRIGSYLALKTLLSLLLGVISYGVMALYGLLSTGE
jgi:predicted PurR-regulated permease PerM